MQGVIEIPVWLAILGGLAASIALLDRVLGPGVRWYMRRRLDRAVDELNQRLSLRIQPFKLMRRRTLIDRLTHDPQVMEAVELHVADTGMPRDLAIRQVERYAKEITPSFSAYMYFRVGARISKWLAEALYRVRLGAFDREALAAVDASAAVVFVMNHRSNVDYLLVTHLASTSSALSYAVGEWARVWPLSRIIRAMGAYFIRRKSRDGLYRAVLRRYVQMATEGGVAQAIFPEGGLSRDGRIGRPKLGLLSYLVDGFDPAGPRDVVFVPVGLNYDRVLEDRLLIGVDGEHGATRFEVSLWTSLKFTFGFALGRLTGRAHRFGYACVSFGAPLSLREFARAQGGTEIVEPLGDELARRIGAVVPVLPASLVAAILLERDGAPIPMSALSERAAALAEEMAAEGAHLHIPREDFAYAAEVGARMLTLRRIASVEEGGLRLVEAERPLLRFYANAVAHLSPRREGEPGQPIS